MKKRAMKKWIPKNTVYCDGCKWWHHIGLNKLYLNDCEYKEECKSKGTVCGSSTDTMCACNIIKCDYLGIVDDTERTLLHVSCKECGIHYD